MKQSRGNIFVLPIIILIAIVVILNCHGVTSTEAFVIYYANPNTYTMDKDHAIEIGQNLGLIQKLRIIADSLSVIRFHGLTIDVDTIKIIDGKKVAMVNLLEYSQPDNIDTAASSGEKHLSWQGGYFQGSTGGWCTTNTLRNTFLQPDYKGDWIDGVEFLYESKAMDNWDHVTLYGIQYREAKE